MSRTLIITANSSCARILESHHDNNLLTEIETLLDTAVRLRDQDLVSDKSGRQNNGKGSTSSHGVNEHHERKHQHHKQFAHSVVEAIERADNKRPFDALYIIAAPEFLGSIRKKLSTTTYKKVKGQISKNITHDSLEKIRSYLPKKL
ncbi:MAG: Host attachment protein [Gammaproteobacteria bacterium]|nr:MAG: Host attachment protein [Gammaproteobacteria bacterium]